MISLINFWNLRHILKVLKKELIVIPTLFRKLQTVKDLARPLSKKHRLRTAFDSQHVKGSQTLVKSTSEYFQHIFSSLWDNLSWKISTLVICQIWDVYCNTLTANDKYPFRDRENFSTPIQMQLSLKQKTFSHFFNQFPESTSHFKSFEKKDDRQSYFITEITACQKLG